MGVTLAQLVKAYVRQTDGWLGRYTNVEYLQKSIPEETRTITVPSLSGL